MPAIEIKPYKSCELADLYGIDKKTFLRWLIPFSKEIGERRGQYYTKKQVKIIIDKIDTP